MTERDINIKISLDVSNDEAAQQMSGPYVGAAIQYWPLTKD
jgi:hypothetical protein